MKKMDGMNHSEFQYSHEDWWLPLKITKEAIKFEIPSVGRVDELRFGLGGPLQPR
jgi:hypothetical protein